MDILQLSDLCSAPITPNFHPVNWVWEYGQVDRIAQPYGRTRQLLLRDIVLQIVLS